MGVNVLAGLDVVEANPIIWPYFDQGFACTDSAHSRLMAGRYVVEKDHVLIRKPFSAAQILQRHNYIVVGVQPDV